MKKMIPFLLVLMIAVSSCKTNETVSVEQVPVKTARVEKIADTVYVYKNVESKDRMYEKDSVQVVYKDSCVYVDRWHTRYADRKIFVTDTVHETKYVYITDSIDKPLYINKTEYVEKELSWLQRFLICLGVIFLLTVTYRIYRFFRP